MTDTTTTRTPWHLWVVGGVSLLWNGFGAYDFIMTTTQGESYLKASGFDQAMIAYFTAMPAWMYGPWTLGVWGRWRARSCCCCATGWRSGLSACRWSGP